MRTQLLHGDRLLGDRGCRAQRQEVITGHPSGLEPRIGDRPGTEVHVQVDHRPPGALQPQGPDRYPHPASTACRSDSARTFPAGRRTTTTDRPAASDRDSHAAARGRASRAIHSAAGSCASAATSATTCSQTGASFRERGRWFAICRRNSSPSGSRGIGRANVLRRQLSKPHRHAGHSRDLGEGAAVDHMRERARRIEPGPRHGQCEQQPGKSSRRDRRCASAAPPEHARRPGNADGSAAADVRACRNARRPGAGPARDSGSHDNTVPQRGLKGPLADLVEVKASRFHPGSDPGRARQKSRGEPGKRAVVNMVASKPMVVAGAPR